MQIDVQVTEGADGPSVRISCPDRTSMVRLGDLLPALRSITDKVVEAAVEREQAAGGRISCKAGCAACCRQLIPISATEARELPRLIAGLGDDLRRRVVARFEDAISALRASRIWSRLERYASLSEDERGMLSIEYLQLGIACPFLEGERCSIHPVKPLVCRQYLVTSPAACCSDPAAGIIAPVFLAANVCDALKRIEMRDPGRSEEVPLTLAPFLNLAENESRKTAFDWMRGLLGQIKRSRDRRIAAGLRMPDP
jgi:Fe-S-cluster containining protein